MKAITLRNLPPDLVRAIRRKAGTDRTSLNKTVIGLLEERLGGHAKSRAKVTYHDLDHLAGAWSKREGAEFDKALAGQRRIDPDLWK